MHGETCGLCRFWTACDTEDEELIGICREGSPAYHEGLGYVFPVTPSVESCGRFEAKETELSEGTT